MLLLDTKNNVVGQRVVYQGNVSSAIIRPAEVLRPAVIEAVPSIIISHNQPQPGPDAQPGGRGHHQGDFPGGKAPGHRASGPCRHRRGEVHQPQGAGPHGLTLHKSGRPTPSGPHAGDSLSRASSDTNHKGEIPCLRHTTCLPTRQAASTRRPVYDQRGRLLGHRRRLRPRPPTPRDSGSCRWWEARRRSRPSGPPCSSSPRKWPTSSKGRTEWRFRAAYERCSIPYNTIGTWTDQDSPPAGERRMARAGLYQDGGIRLRAGTTSCCWCRARARPPRCTTVSSTREVPCPCTAPGAGWLWERGLENGEIAPLQSSGVVAYRCSPNAERLREDLSGAVASGRLALPEEGTDG